MSFTYDDAVLIYQQARNPKYRRPKMPNLFQQKVCKEYGLGEYAHIAEMAEPAATAAVNDVGDMLFQFIYRDLADEPEEPMDADTANQRMQSALHDLMGIAEMIEVMS